MNGKKIEDILEYPLLRLPITSSRPCGLANTVGNRS